VPILRADHFAIQTILFRVREVAARRSTGAERCEARMSNIGNEERTENSVSARGRLVDEFDFRAPQESAEDMNMLHDFRCDPDSVASGFQSPRGRRSDPLAAGSSVGGCSHRPCARPPRGVEAFPYLCGPYLCWKRTRRPRLIAAFRTRRAAWPEFSGREILKADNSRSRCVLVDGCPVLSVHFFFGLAPHMGQRTDNICPNVSFAGFRPILFNIAHGQSWSLEISTTSKRESNGN